MVPTWTMLGRLTVMGPLWVIVAALTAAVCLAGGTLDHSAPGVSRFRAHKQVSPAGLLPVNDGTVVALVPGLAD